MKHIHLTLLAIALLFLSTLAAGQKVRETNGDLNVLKGIKKLNVKYDYANMEVGKNTEADYVADKKNSYNRKEQGRGDKWAAEWVADRSRRFEPRFEELFNDNSDIKIGNYPAEKYTLIFKTVYTEPGFNVGVARRNAYIDAEVWIVETAHMDNVVAKLTCEDCPGRTAFGTDFDNGLRLQESYATAGRALGKYLRKHVD